MKKKIFGGIIVLAIAAVVTFNVNLNSQSDKLSVMSLANIEALADGESHDVDCSKEGGECTIKAPNGYEVIILNFQKPQP